MRKLIAVTMVVMAVGLSVAYGEYIATKPYVYQPIAGFTCDKMWMTKLLISAPTPEGLVSATVEFVQYGIQSSTILSNGIVVASVKQAPGSYVINMADLYAVASSNQSLANALATVTAAVKDIAVARGLMKQ